MHGVNITIPISDVMVYSDIYLYGNAPRSKWQFLSNVLVCVGEISETLANRNNGRPWIGFFQGAEGDSVPKGDLDFA